MKKLITNYRYWVLSLLWATCIISLMAVPGDDLSLAAFITVLIGSKFGQAALTARRAVIHYRLFIRWADRGEIPEFTRFN